MHGVGPAIVGGWRLFALVRRAAAGVGARASPALVVVLGLMVWAVHAHARDLKAPLWVDEGISLGVADHRLSAIPGVLQQDGAPPLFYLLLHFWASVLGYSARSGHALSLLCATLAVPAAYWAAVAPFGRRAGMLAAAIVALDPFAATYAIEVRMYSLLLLTGLLATGAFVRAFVLRPGQVLWAVAFGAALAAVLYTHNWGVFFAVACGLVWLALIATGEPARRRALVVSGVIGFGGCAVAFVPWVPTLLEQTRHTGAPWSHAPHWHSVGPAVRRMLGGAVSATVLALFALDGARRLLRRPLGKPAKAALAILAIAVLTFAIAYAWSNVSGPAWALRYLCIVLAPAAVAMAAALTRIGSMAPVVLAVVFVAFWHGRPTHAALAHKSNVAVVARRLGPLLAPGTLVFSTQPEQVPVLYHYLPAGMRFVTPLGPVRDPRVMDWRDAMTRLDAPAAARTFRAVLRHLRPGERLLLVQPRFTSPTAPWPRRVRQLARQARRWRAAHRDVRVVASVVPRRGYTRATVSALLLMRRDAGRR